MYSDVLNDSRISRLIELALLEDIGLGDVTSESILSDAHLGQAEFHCKEDGIIAGLEVAALVFQYCDHSITLEPKTSEGNAITSGDIIAKVDGSAKGILKGERTALNFMQRMSGIATATKRYVNAVEGTRAKIIDTRKTVPGLRVLDKLAVRTGGGANHRFGLDDMFLIKENHVFAAGGIKMAVARAKKYQEKHQIALPVEVETTNLTEVEEALSTEGIQRIMLDNFSLDDMRRAVELINRRVEVEASGGVNLATVRSIAETGVDLISVGALTHSVKALDISLELLYINDPHSSSKCSTK